MKKIIIVPIENDQLPDNCAKLLGALSFDGNKTDVILLGNKLDAVKTDISKLGNIDNIFLLIDEKLSHPVAEDVYLSLASHINNYDIIAMACDGNGKNILPFISAKLDMVMMSDVIEIIDHENYKRPIYAGNAIEHIVNSEQKKIMTIRTTAFDAVSMDGNDASCTELKYVENENGAKFHSEDLNQSSRPELTSAKVIVSGGRGIGSKENFENIILPLADKLNAAVGASRAAVDAGFVSNDLQVGQTGKIVAPDIYIAIGISGAIQHIAGMKDSGKIFVINDNEEAPIFEIADFGLVGDLFDIVPKLTEKL